MLYNLQLTCTDGSQTDKTAQSKSTNITGTRLILMILSSDSQEMTRSNLPRTVSEHKDCGARIATITAVKVDLEEYIGFGRIWHDLSATSSPRRRLDGPGWMELVGTCRLGAAGMAAIVFGACLRDYCKQGARGQGQGIISLLDAQDVSNHREPDHDFPNAPHEKRTAREKPPEAGHKKFDNNIFVGETPTANRYLYVPGHLLEKSHAEKRWMVFKKTVVEPLSSGDPSPHSLEREAHVTTDTGVPAL
ncbi:hypothetical protein Bbelb_208210 [Branchiostoma belcheri]|nr:hypothetical protein Bbelb_208210 [Branchiostoma belcheri]